MVSSLGESRFQHVMAYEWTDFHLRAMLRLIFALRSKKGFRSEHSILFQEAFPPFSSFLPFSLPPSLPFFLEKLKERNVYEGESLILAKVWSRNGTWNTGQRKDEPYETEELCLSHLKREQCIKCFNLKHRVLLHNEAIEIHEKFVLLFKKSLG